MNFKRVHDKTPRTLIAFLIMPFISSAALSETYYVDATNGDDTNQGTSESRPWKTISKVNKSIIQPGDRILFKRDGVWRETLIVSSSGQPGTPIIFGAYGRGKKPVISGANEITNWELARGWGSVYYAELNTEPDLVFYNDSQLSESDGARVRVENNEWDWESNTLYVNVGVDPDKGVLEAGQRDHGVLNSQKHIVIENLHFKYGNSRGITIRKENGSTPSDVEIRNCTFTKMESFGIRIAHGSGYEVHDNTFVMGTPDVFYGFACIESYVPDVSIYRNRMSRAQVGVVLEDESGSASPRVYENVIHDMSFPQDLGSISTHADLHGIDVGGSSNGITGARIYRNLIYDCDGDGIIIDSTTNTEVHYNVIYNSGNKKIYAGEGGIQVADGAKGTKLYNNTIYNCWYGISVDGRSPYSIIKNNIISNVNYRGIRVTEDSRPGLVADYNCVYNSATADYVGLERGQHDINVNPLLLDPSKNSFSLRLNSPCIDAGIDVGIAKDFRGTQVPLGNQVDLGAFEATSVRIVPTPQREHGSSKLKNVAVDSLFAELPQARLRVTAEPYRQPTEFKLHQSYPNPFNPTTTIQYDLPESGKTVLRIFNVLGQQVRQITAQNLAPGHYRLNWDGTDETGRTTASGIYIYRLELQTKSGRRLIETEKMILAR